MISPFRKSVVATGESVKDANDFRLKNIIHDWNRQKIDVGIIGVPFDYGIVLSKGRQGASLAPDSIRSEIKKYGTAYNLEKNINLSGITVADFGNVKIVNKNSLQTHHNVSNAVSIALQHACVIIVFGGGHDLSYATVKALFYDHKNIGGLNIDSHLDVRPVVDGRLTSGTAYRRLIEQRLLKGKNFFEIAIQGHVNSKVHYDWLKKQGANILFLSDVRSLGIKSILKKCARAFEKNEATFVSVDMDSLAQTFAPGVSAPNPDGLYPGDILNLAYFAGENSKVRIFEIMEVNPKYDVDNKTSRLAVNILIEFLSGYAKRKQKQN